MDLDGVQGEGKSFEDLQTIAAPFGEELVPLHVFFMRTKHEVAKNAEKMADDMLDKLSVPKPIKDMMRAKLLAKISKTGDKTEFHCLVLAHDKVKRKLVGITNTGHIHGDGTEHLSHTPKSMGDALDEDDKESGVLLASMTALEMEHAPYWHGERQTPIVIEAESFSEFMDKANDAGIKEDFLKLFPETQVSPIKAAVPVGSPMTEQRRKELIKRFGKKNIEDLEAKLKGK